MRSKRDHKIWPLVFVIILMLTSPGQICAGADTLTTFTVTSTADSGPGSMRQAIINANAAAGDIKIVIAVDGTLTTATVLPELDISGRSGWIQGRPGTTITGFSCQIGEAGTLTLQNVNIDNSAYIFDTIRAYGHSKLLLDGSNNIKGNGHQNGIIRIDDSGANLAIDKTPDGSDMDCTLTLKDSSDGVFGPSELEVRGGTLYSHGGSAGIGTGLLVTGGKVVATGGSYGIVAVYKKSFWPVTINGGTVIAQGAIDIETGFSYLTINGGSVNARNIPFLATNGNGDIVYLVTVTVGDPPVKNAGVTCAVNGSTPFSCMTDDEGKLYLWMPEGQGSAEIATGGLIYHASGIVEANYDNTMLATADPIVTGVVVTPAYTTALTGSTVQFSARVEGLGHPPQTVTWKVENGHQGTFIDDSGLLTISPRESSTNLLVTATSTYDPGKSRAAQVAVLSVIGIIMGAVLLFLLIVLLAVFLEVRNPFRQ
jgi:hypothetical protein